MSYNRIIFLVIWDGYVVEIENELLFWVIEILKLCG